MTFNTSLAEQVLGHIKAYPETHVQQYWRCNAGMCFAGWAVQLTGHQWVTESFGDYAEMVVYPIGYEQVSDYDIDPGRLLSGVNSETLITTAQCAAMDELGVSDDDSDVLFYAHNTVEHLEQAVKLLANGEHIAFSRVTNSHGNDYEIVALPA